MIEDRARYVSRTLSRGIVTVWVLSICSAVAMAQPAGPASIDELRQELTQILNRTRTPGAAVAIVERDGKEWAAGLGKADADTGIAATPETLFRVGSISKGFVSLAVLILAERGQLSLDDTLRSLVPEVLFENRWEATDPIRVAHLLEHTTGWGDIHLREYAKDAAGVSLRAALDYDPDSRVSRWRPGTRMAYSNSGPAVAAYVVEKLTGQRFEDFVAENVFQPVGMRTATYFQPRAEFAATLYHDDGTREFPYWNMIFRPSGAVNASAQDMLAYLRFHLQRGNVYGKPVLSASAFDRLERPMTSWAAKAGLTTGYGLGNWSNIEDGFVYHGHDGTVNGGLSQFWYMPEYGVGYFYSINSENGDASERIGHAVRAYLTRELKPPQLTPESSVPADAIEYSGWYEPASSNIEWMHFVERFSGLSHVRIDQGKLFFSSRDRENWAFTHTAASRFRFVPATYAAEPAATLALFQNEEGRFLQFRMMTLRHIPTWLVIAEFSLLAYAAICMASVLAYAPFWIVSGLLGRRRLSDERAMRVWPFVAVVSLLAAGLILNGASDDPFSKLAHPSVWSIALFVTTAAFPIAALASAVAVWRSSKRSRAIVRVHSAAVTAALLVVAVYLAYWGVVGIRTWS